MLAAHRDWLKNARYMPKLPWKKGERDAFRTASSKINTDTVPIFIIPPAGDFDHDMGRITSPAEHVRMFGPRLWEARKDKPVFIDARYLDDDRHRIEFNVHPVTALLERARLAKAHAWPLTSYGRSDAYQEAVAKAHIQHGYPIAMQIGLSDLGGPNLDTRLKSLCNQVSCDPKDAVLVIDAGPLQLGDEQKEELFADALVPILNDLPNLYEWSQIAFSATSLSDPQKIKQGQQKTIRRSEWFVFRKLVSKKSELSRLPAYSDFGVEFTSNLAPRKAMPSAKLSYTTDESHYYAKGENVKKAGYKAIYPVAKTVVSSGHFKGPEFSQGDAKIWKLSLEEDSTGNAPTWKWAVADHHLEVISRQISAVLGEKIPTFAQTTESIALQPELFSLISAK